jgi:hypothetical protein
MEGGCEVASRPEGNISHYYGHVINHKTYWHKTSILLFSQEFRGESQSGILKRLDEPVLTLGSVMWL